MSATTLVWCKIDRRDEPTPDAACFIVKDHNGHAPAYVYLQNEPGRRAAAKPQTKEEPRRINFAKLLELLWRTPKPM